MEHKHTIIDQINIDYQKKINEDEQFALVYIKPLFMLCILDLMQHNLDLLNSTRQIHLTKVQSTMTVKDQCPTEQEEGGATGETTAGSDSNILNGPSGMRGVKCNN